MDSPVPALVAVPVPALVLALALVLVLVHAHPLQQHLIKHQVAIIELYHVPTIVKRRFHHHHHQQQHQQQRHCQNLQNVKPYNSINNLS